MEGFPPADDMEARLKNLLASGQTSSELLDRAFAPMAWLVRDLVPSEGLCVLGAKMGLGKSYMLLQLAVALSTGTPFLGRETERQGVLLIALEDSDRRINARLNQLGAIGTDRLLIYTRWQKGKTALEDLRLLLKSRRWIRAVVIDPIIKFIDLIDMNAYEQAYGALGPLKECLDAHGVAGVFAHHCKKSVAELDAFDDLLGSTGWGASCDSRLVLRRNRGSDDAILVAGGRDVLHSESALHFDMNRGWEYQGSAQDVGMSETRKTILDILQREGPLAARELMPILDDLSPSKEGGPRRESTVRTLLTRMRDQGLVLQEVDRRWNAAPKGRSGVAVVAVRGGEALSERQNVEDATAATGATGSTTTTHTTALREISFPSLRSEEAIPAEIGGEGYAGGDNGR